jgi:hypothetical protein
VGEFEFAIALGFHYLYPHFVRLKTGYASGKPNKFGLPLGFHYLCAL